MGLFDNSLEHCEKNAQWITSEPPSEIVRLKQENARLTAQVEKLRTENDTLKSDLEANKTMLARQCDLAREAETKEMAMQKKLEELKDELDMVGRGQP